MTFDELKLYDCFGAFDDWITVREAKERGVIPKKFHSMIEDYCDCGSERIMTLNRKSYTCCDFDCPIKMEQLMQEIFVRFGIKGIGQSGCREIIKCCKENTTSIFKIFSNLDSFSYKLSPSLYSNLHQSVSKIKNSNLTIEEMVTFIAIPGATKTAKQLVQGYKTVDDLVRDINLNGINTFLIKKGITNKSVMFNFTVYINDIIDAYEFLENSMVKDGGEEIKLVITGGLTVKGKSVSRQEYIEVLNKISTRDNGTREFTFINSKCRETANIFVADYKSGSTSYKTAERREKEEGRKLIYTAEELAFLIYKLVRGDNSGNQIRE